MEKFWWKVAQSRSKILKRLEKICLQVPPIFKYVQSIEQCLKLLKQYSNSWRVTENKQKFEKFEIFLSFHMQKIMKDRCWHFLGSIQMSEFSTFFLDFCPLKNSIRVSFYFSGIQSTLLNMLIQFSKKSESKNFRPKSLNLP